jgi:hypothetical protein
MPIGLGSPISNKSFGKLASHVAAACLLVSTVAACGFAAHRILRPVQSAETKTEAQEDKDEQEK